MVGIQVAIQQKIVAAIASVSNTGRVYDRVKYSANWQRFKDQFSYADPIIGRTFIKGWWVTLPTLEEDDSGSTFDMHWHNYTYPIHAVMTYSDEGDTEPVFGDMVWAVHEKLHNQGTLGLGPQNPVGDSSVVPGSIDVSVPTVDLRFFGSILCHHAQLNLTVGVADPVNFQP